MTRPIGIPESNISPYSTFCRYCRIAGFSGGIGAAAGVYTEIRERWKLLLSGDYKNFPVGDRRDRYEFKAEQRVTLIKDWSVRVDFKQQRRGQEYLVNLHYYF